MVQEQLEKFSRTYCVTYDCVLKDDLREIFNSSNKRCTIVYKQTAQKSNRL